MNRSVSVVALLVIASLLVTPVAVADENDDIPTNAQNTGVHDSLVDALVHADLVSTLQGDGPFTVFAPTDAAFADAGIDLSTFDTDEENATLVDILTYHVYSGSVAAADVTDGMSATMVNGDNATFTVTNDSVMIGDATVTTADVMASNGIIHVIDKVLMPPADLGDIPTVAQGTGAHDSLVAAVIQANLLMTLQGDGPFTVFAPTDAAFADAGIDLSTFDTDEENATLVDILTYHVYSGSVAAADVTDGMSATMVNGDNVTFTVTNESVMIGDATVTSADVMASNGIIHVIDKVLMPPADLGDIPTVAQGTGAHDSLVAAVIQANLLTTLQGDGPFTVFAPTDAAFADAGIDLSTFDTDEENATLVDILTYHVYSGSVAAADVTDGMSATMVNGDSVTFTVTDGTVMVGDATVTTGDVMASNGIIHVIDKVLMPPADAPDTTDCAAIIGIDASGLAYDQTDISVDVGDTVCWIWSDESMGHNVAETGGPSDNYRKMSGVYSGAVAETIDFRHTFTEDETFYYMCEPHVSMDMRGKITVGNGTPPAVPAPDDEPSNTVPGFGIVAVALSAFAALILIRVETLRMIRPIAPRIPREV